MHFLYKISTDSDPNVSMANVNKLVVPDSVKDVCKSKNGQTQGIDDELVNYLFADFMLIWKGKISYISNHK